MEDSSTFGVFEVGQFLFSESHVASKRQRRGAHPRQACSPGPGNFAARVGRLVERAIPTSGGSIGAVALRTEKRGESLDHIPPIEAEMLCGSEEVLIVGMDFAEAVFLRAREVEGV